MAQEFANADGWNCCTAAGSTKSAPAEDNILQIHYRGSELNLPENEDICRCGFASLYSVAMIGLAIACGYTNPRLDIDELSAVVNQQYGGQLDEESLFPFCYHRTG